MGSQAVIEVVILEYTDIPRQLLDSLKVKTMYIQQLLQCHAPIVASMLFVSVPLTLTEHNFGCVLDVKIRNVNLVKLMLLHHQQTRHHQTVHSPIICHQVTIATHHQAL
jgi:hypothetical protein